MFGRGFDITVLFRGLHQQLGRALPGGAILIVLRQSEDEVRSVREGVELGAVSELDGAGEPCGPAAGVLAGGHG